jgi:undecaprenyl-diphosphatase
MTTGANTEDRSPCSARSSEQDPDVSLLRRMSVRRGTRAERVVRALVPLGDDLKPWLAATPVLALTGPRGRRALGRGWTAIGLAVVLAKAVEGMVSRTRPGPAALGDRAVAGDEPSSTSFPSTHTSSAVAFAGAVTVTVPRAGWLVVPLAGLVAWSRPAGGRHYPSDVAGGAAVGALAAAVVISTARHGGRSL